MTEQPLLWVTVPVPSYVPRRRGIAATSALNTKRKVYLNDSDAMLIDEVANMYGIGIATFMRWASVQLAASIMEKVNGERPPVFDP